MEPDNIELLKQINFPADLRKLPVEKLPEVCAEIRRFLIGSLAHNPGHFGSSMGAVELTVALHYVFDTPYDRIVWDVGHQAYGHKILTGRRERFDTCRKLNGLSGFPNPAESEYDAFIAGHASNSISAALGMAIATRLKHEEKERKVIAVIGDASIAGGLAFEGLNNASINPNNLLIILNDNDMAIDHNVGGLNEYLVNITTSRGYNRLRYDAYRTLRRFNLIDEEHRGAILRFNNSLKAAPAEKEPTIWHAPGCFDPATGQRKSEPEGNKPPKFQDVFGHTLVELAEQNDKITVITPAMPTGSSSCFMMERFPQRSFDVGISEEHAVTFAAGLAKEGLQPFCSIYSTFLQRAFDEVIHDVAIQKLPVTFCIDRAGLVGEDGVTHHGVFDLCYLRCIPNMTIAAPMDEHYLRHLMYTAQLRNNGPFAIRYPRGSGSQVDWRCPMHELPIGKGRQLCEGDDIAVLCVGPIGVDALHAVQRAREAGVKAALYDMIFVKPLDEEILHEVGQKYKRVITLEDGSITGGFGSAVLEFMADHGYTPRIKRMGIPDRFIAQGSVKELHQLCGIDEESIYATLMGN